MCRKCSRKTKWSRGLFCLNYSRSVKGFNPCHQAWCGNCYTSREYDKFHVAHLTNHLCAITKPGEIEIQAVNPWIKTHRKSDDFLKGRDGDTLLVPFECDSCIFIKLKGRNVSVDSQKDDLLLRCIRRVNLDSF